MKLRLLRGLERATVQDLRRACGSTTSSRFLGRTKLSDSKRAGRHAVQERPDEEKGGVTGTESKRTTVSLGSIIADAQENGLASHNAVRDLRRSKNGRSG